MPKLTSDRLRTVLRRVFKFQPVAIVLAIALVAFTAGSTGEREGSVVRDVIGQQDVRLSIPTTDDPRGIALFFHGQTGGVDNRMDEPWLQALVRDGWIVGSSDFHTASWGDAESTEDTIALEEWAEKTTGEEVELFVSGSMGAAVSLNALTHGVEAPTCWYGVKPAVDITKMGAVPKARQLIREAYGEVVPLDRNPVNTISELSTDTRYRMVSSFADPWVKRRENTDVLASRLLKMGAEVTVLTAKGTHDDPSHFDVHDLVDFAATCADS